MVAFQGKQLPQQALSTQILNGSWPIQWPLPSKTANAPDDVLLRLIQEGSETDSQNALETLFVRHHKDVWRYVRSRVSSASDADEITAAVWLVVLEKICDFVWTGTPIKSWLLSIAHRKIREFFNYPPVISLDNLGDGHGEVIHFLASQLNLISDPVSQVSTQVRNEADVLLHKLISRLPEIERKIITLIYFEELENASEVAQRLEMNKNTIRVYHKRARDKLRAFPELSRLFEDTTGR
jgi:RNA polymerase sigma factor (sigma-70 family)